MTKKYSILMMGLPLVGAIAAPIGYFKFVNQGKTAQAAGDSPAAIVQPAARQRDTAIKIPIAGSEVNGSSAPLAGAGNQAARPSRAQVQDAGSVFDFRITPEWILAHWPAVSTGLAELQLEGYRVPLVTGTARQDLAGSLTYYFNAEQKLDRITFVGVSGDPRPLMDLLGSRFKMSRRLTNDPGLVLYEGASPAHNRSASMMRIRLSRPIQPGETYRRYDIELSLERPVE